MSRQLALNLPYNESHRRADFIISPSTSLALEALDNCANWPEGKMLLIGPNGTGKTHLASIWAEAQAAAVIEAHALDLTQVPKLVAFKAVVIENAELIAGHMAAEEALFHLHNLLLPMGRLLITAQEPPRDWGLKLPDLLSRMQATSLIRIDKPDDDVLSGVLQKLFADRQLHIPAQIIPWLIARMPRSIGAARLIVAELDALALERNQPISIKLATEILERTPEE